MMDTCLRWRSCMNQKSSFDDKASTVTTRSPLPLRPQDTELSPPSAWVIKWLPFIRRGGRVLDYASGSGRHARLACEAGHDVLAVDRDSRALSSMQSTGIDTWPVDLEHGRLPFGAERFEAIICTNYLFRPRLDLMASWLAPGGLLIYETFARGNARYGRPANPDFLLQPGELAGLAWRCGLHLLAFEDGYVATPRPARLQRMVALAPPFDLERFPLG
jgi:SAM-dependent methyltransferase